MKHKGKRYNQKIREKKGNKEKEKEKENGENIITPPNPLPSHAFFYIDFSQPCPKE